MEKSTDDYSSLFAFSSGCNYETSQTELQIIDAYDFRCQVNENEEFNNQLTESHLDVPRDPFNPKCRIPLPDLYGNYIMFDSTTFIRRRNERERTRVRNVNEGFERLRNHLPILSGQKDKRLSKVETLRFAISYINHLQGLLDQGETNQRGN